MEQELEKKKTKKTTKASTTKKTTTSSTKSKKTDTKSKPKKTTTTVKKTTKTSKSDTKKVSASSTKTRKKTTTKTSKKTTTKKDTGFKVEYYDLLYRYNQTVVKILAQTPNTLFIYWDISDNDRNKYIEEFGDNFFNNSRPILIINNLTKNYTYEIEIDDFANSWYLRCEEPNCNYEISLGRKLINNYSVPEQSSSKFNNGVIIVTTSNDLQTPNDHILLENVFSHSPVFFKNVKTGEIIKKTYGDFPFNFIYGETKGIKEFYKTFYNTEIFENDNTNNMEIKHISSSKI